MTSSRGTPPETPDEYALAAKLDRVANRVAKWRKWYAGWQLGTRPDTDPEAAAVRDQRELLIFLRSELSAVTKLLEDKKVFTIAEFTAQLIVELEALDADYERKWPGVKATDNGLSLDLAKARETMAKYHFRP